MRIAASFRVRWCGNCFVGFGVTRSEVVLLCWPCEFRLEYSFGRWA